MLPFFVLCHYPPLVFYLFLILFLKVFKNLTSLVGIIQNYFYRYKTKLLVSFGCVGSLLLLAGFLGEQGLLFTAVCGLLIAVASLVTEHGLQACEPQQLRLTGSVVVAHRLSCSMVRVIFLDQGSNPCPGRQIPNHRAIREVPKLLFSDLAKEKKQTILSHEGFFFPPMINCEPSMALVQLKEF